MEKFTLVWAKLKAEWKSFVLQVGLFITASWELAVSMGADLPSLFTFLPETWRPWALFAFAAGMLAVRRYSPVVQELSEPSDGTPSASDPPTVK